MLLEIENVVGGYGRVEILHGVSLGVEEGEIVSILGANGAGKTTLLRTISALLPAWSGSIRFAGKELVGMKTESIAARGLGHLPEGRGIFQMLTVQENFDVAASLRRDSRAEVRKDIARLLSVFPALTSKLKHPAALLSGGQQQMLALARALLGRPKLLMIDELSFGLAAVLVEELFTTIQQLRDQGTTFLIVEQNAGVLEIADRVYVMRGGRNEVAGAASEFAENRDLLVRSYLGG